MMKRLRTDRLSKFRRVYVLWRGHKISKACIVDFPRRTFAQKWKFTQEVKSYSPTGPVK